MSAAPKESTRIRRLTITNFKALDHLEIEFPLPRMRDDPDIFVLGSANGVGKTSVLEACAILLTIDLWHEENCLKSSFQGINNLLGISLFLSIGTDKLSLSGIITNNGTDKSWEVFVDKEQLEIRLNQTIILTKKQPPDRISLGGRDGQLLGTMLGLLTEPVVNNRYILFNSFRLIYRRNPDLGMLAASDGNQDLLIPVSFFKYKVVRLLLEKSDLIEMGNTKMSSIELDELNKLVSRYADGYIAKLKGNSDNSYELRFTPINLEKSFPFDNLSSGQKEIISTLFLIRHHSRDRSNVVLIDEPELHLNAEWQMDYVRQLHRLAPHNQYILATHSEHIAASVPPERCAIIQPNRDI